MQSTSSFSRCGGGCAEDPSRVLWSAENVAQCQKASDFLIALAYFSIPLELFYFVTCSAIFPFRWIIIQFGAFIVLCGLTHLVATFTYGPHSFLLVLALTVLKFLTALVSLATAVSLVRLIPQLLRLFVRDGLLRQKARDLHRSLGLMRRQEAASWHVRMLTAEIRRSLDRHTILHTTLVHLSTALLLHDCAVWMPTSPSSMALTHRLRSPPPRGRVPPVPAAAAADDPHVAAVVAAEGVVILHPGSILIAAASASAEPGPAAAIRMPLLRASSFAGGGGGGGGGGGDESAYAILVVVLPAGGGRSWTPHDLEIIEAVAGQVAVALSHAAVLEESLLMREKLLEQNMALDRARREALLAKQARDSFQSMMARKMVGPVRSVAAVLSLLQLEKLSFDRLAVVRGGLVLSSLIEEAAQVVEIEDAKRLDLRFHPFHVRFIVEEVLAMTRILCACQGVSFEFRIFGENPGTVIGDKRRVLHAVSCMVGGALEFGDGGNLFLQVYVEDAAKGGSFDSKLTAGELNVGDGILKLRFEVRRTCLREKDSSGGGGKYARDRERSLLICEKLAHLMHGSISVSPLSTNLQKNMQLLIRLQRPQSKDGIVSANYMDLGTTLSVFRGMRILLVDDDHYNISVTTRLLEKLGCQFSKVSSWYHCLEMLYLKGNQFHLLLIDLQILEEDRRELSARIKKLKMESWPLIVAVTPKTDRNTREQCLHDGIHGVICKPVILQEMIDELQKVTQQMQAPFPLR